MSTEEMHTELGGKLTVRLSFEGPRRSDGCIKWNVKELECICGMLKEMAQDRVQCRRILILLRNVS
jgi:hypothetical protein